MSVIIDTYLEEPDAQQQTVALECAVMALDRTATRCRADRDAYLAGLLLAVETHGVIGARAMLAVDYD